MIKLYEVKYAYGEYSDYTESSIAITDSSAKAIEWAQKFEVENEDEWIDDIFIDIHYLNEYYPKPSKAVIEAERDGHLPTSVYDWKEHPDLLEQE